MKTRTETGTLLITVFDLCAMDCARTARTLREYFADCDFSVAVAEFTNIQLFVLNYKRRYDAGEPFDMAFVGVDSMMGAEAARAVREMDKELPLFLVSEVSDFALEGYRLTALDYLTKPVSARAVEEAVARVTAPCFASHRTPALLRRGTDDIR